MFGPMIDTPIGRLSLSARYFSSLCRSAKVIF